MPAIVLVSAKGSPGVTTTAAAVAAVATGRVRTLLAELDPSGGSIRVLTDHSAASGLVDAATQLRRTNSPAAIAENTVVVGEGIPALLAPTAGMAAASVIASIGDRWVEAMAPWAGEVYVDAGRWELDQRTAGRIAGADVLALVCRPTLAGVEHSRYIVDRLHDSGRPVAVIVVGDRPYEPEEVAAHLDLPLAGALAWDRRAVASLWAGGANRWWLRTPLARSAGALRHALHRLAAPAPEVRP
jgi:hypothetical protein